jgi:hypothetical protein
MPPGAPGGQAALQIVPAPPEPQIAPPGRLVAFLAIVAIGSLWLQHHIGFEFGKLGFIALLATVWGGVGKLADWIGEKSAIGRLMDKVFKTPLRAVVRYMTRTTPLYTSGVIVGVLMATISSVAVRSDAPGERSAVSLASLDSRGAPRSDTLTRDRAVVRFIPVLTSPFGRLYEVDADGYVPTQIAVYPLLGRQVLLGRDLAASPSVLFRPFAEGISALHDGATFQVSRLHDGRWERLAVSDSSGVASSFLIGRRKPISDAAIVVWAMEATANGATESGRAQLLVTWRNIRQLAIDRELHPRDCLLAEIRLNDHLKERALVPLSNEGLVDVLMHPITGDTTKAPSC